MERDGMVLRMRRGLGVCERFVGGGCKDPQDARFVSFNTVTLVTMSDNINRLRSRRKRYKEKGYRSLAIVLVLLHLPRARMRHGRPSPLPRVRPRITAPLHVQDGPASFVLNSRRVPHISSKSHVDGLVISRTDDVA